MEVRSSLLIQENKGVRQLVMPARLSLWMGRCEIFEDEHKMIEGSREEDEDEDVAEDVVEDVVNVEAEVKIEVVAEMGEIKMAMTMKKDFDGDSNSDQGKGMIMREGMMM